jgi:hypothetical protein
MVKAGDAARLSPDASEELLNVFHRPGPRLDKRGGWKSDVLGSNPTAGDGYMLWREVAQNRTRLILNNGTFYIKDAGAETWGSGIAGAGAGVKDYTQYRGAVYWMANLSGGVPQRYSYDGAALDIDPFRERLSSESMVAWKDRLWFFNFYQFVNNRLGTTNAYAIGLWTPTNVNEAVVTASGITTSTITPTNTTSAKVELDLGYTVPSGSEDTHLVYRSNLRGKSPSYRMPVTLEIYVSQAAARSTAYSVGVIRRPTTPNGFRYRVITAGTTGAGEPAWGTTIGGTTTDNTVTWVNDGPEAFNAVEIELGNAEDNQGKFETHFVSARIPPMPSSMVAGVRLKFGTTARASWELQPVDFGLKDGLADGDVRKRNYGQQLTVGRYLYEFFNQESSDSAAIQFPNRISWTEPGQPREILEDAFFDMVDGNGGGVVIRPLDWALVAYKRDAIAVYQAVEGAAATFPLEYVKTFPGVGCIHPRAIAIFEGLHFFAGEEEIYLFDGRNTPEPLIGQGMREAIFDKGTSWVETNGTAGYNRPLLRIHEKNRELWLYTQKGKFWIYNLDQKFWSSVNVVKDANQATTEIADLIYFNSKMYAIALDNKLIRLEETATQDDVYSAGVTSYDVWADVWLHPFENLPREHQLIESIAVHHEISGVQGSSTLEAGVSTDRGATFPKSHTVTIPTGLNPIFIPLWQMNPHITVRLRHKGKAGKDYFNLFYAEAWMQDRGLEVRTTNPTTVSATL